MKSGTPIGLRCHRTKNKQGGGTKWHISPTITCSVYILLGRFPCWRWLRSARALHPRRRLPCRPAHPTASATSSSQRSADQKKRATCRFPSPQCLQISLPGRESRTRSEEHTSELQSLMRISYAVFCLKNKK